MIDLIWKKKANQKSHTNNSLFIHDTKWNNYPSFVKLEEIGIDAYRNLCSGIIFSKLDEIACKLFYNNKKRKFMKNYHTHNNKNKNKTKND